MEGEPGDQFVPTGREGLPDQHQPKRRLVLGAGVGYQPDCAKRRAVQPLAQLASAAEALAPWRLTPSCNAGIHWFGIASCFGLARTGSVLRAERRRPIEPDMDHSTNVRVPGWVHIAVQGGRVRHRGSGPSANRGWSGGRRLGGPPC